MESWTHFTLTRKVKRNTIWKASTDLFGLVSLSVRSVLHRSQLNFVAVWIDLRPQLGLQRCQGRLSMHLIGALFWKVRAWSLGITHFQEALGLYLTTEINAIFNLTVDASPENPLFSHQAEIGVDRNNDRPGWMRMTSHFSHCVQYIGLGSISLPHSHPWCSLSFSAFSLISLSLNYLQRRTNEWTKEPSFEPARRKTASGSQKWSWIFHEANAHHFPRCFCSS